MRSSRQDIEFRSHDALCRGWLFRPEAPGAGACIVMAHGLGGTRDAGLEPYALCFAEAGFFVLLFDYRHFGASEGAPRQLVSIGGQLQDWRRRSPLRGRCPGSIRSASACGDRRSRAGTWSWRRRETRGSRRFLRRGR